MKKLNQKTILEHEQYSQSLPGWDNLVDVDMPSLDIETNEVREVVSHEMWSNVYPSRRERLFAQSR